MTSAVVSPRARSGEWFMLYAVSILAALVLSAALVEATGGDWRPVVNALLDGSLRRPGRWGETLGTAAPMLLVATGTIISSKGGLINIGQEGQLFVGAAFATYFGFLLGGPGPLNVSLILIFGAIGGALWAGVAAGLKFWRNVPEVLSTLLLVTVGGQLVAYGLSQPWLLLAPLADRGNRNQVSVQLAEDNRLPRPEIFGNEIPLAVLLGIVLAIVVSFALSRTVWGFRLRMLGRNPRTAQRSGVAQTRYGASALMLSGAFAGLAGAAMLAGGGFAFGNYQLVPGFSTNIGWTGLLVALVAREKALVAIPVAFVFAGLRTGSSFVGATGVEGRITDVIQGFLVLALLVPPAVMFLRDRRRARAAATERV
ncbi:MAG: ABC transporter permease [Acidimicrobiaceae bacterium]|jgi:general nucleoside transport system permease protein|nr:ABC transporter permease [Acidimicrobiaceae bacterium]MBT5580207.1 ABC transporter permease [Acidimicrobiaceae bacterium]MBT5851853.1 ABC transporter permease [Acidimicrobiaceae bacterium]